MDQLVIPVSWVLGVVGILGGVIASLAGIIYQSLTSRLSVQDGIIQRLQDDVDRLSKGCGANGCHWRKAIR